MNDELEGLPLAHSCQIYQPFRFYGHKMSAKDKARGQSQEDSDDNQSRQEAESREIDGFQAWLTLACVFITNATTLGSLKIYGLIYEEIVAQGYYNREDASWPISTASTIQNLAGLLTPILAMSISWRSIEILQTCLFVIAQMGAYFSRGLATDILCLGIIQGVALSIRYNMNVVINNEYFVRYRATAMGISLAGSTCGVFALKPLVSYVLDNSEHQFRNAYLSLGAIMSFNIILGLFIRKPAVSLTRASSPESQDSDRSFGLEDSIKSSMGQVIRNPSLHCIWIAQTIYFYISRTYTIFIVDYGTDRGFSRAKSRDMLDLWVYGEIGGRLLLGSLVDWRLLSLKWNMVLVNLLLALAQYALVVKIPTSGNGLETSQLNVTQSVANGTIGIISEAKSEMQLHYLMFGMSIFLVAALSSLVNMLIVPFGQEYIGKKSVPWAFAIGSAITSLFLLLRPTLIGWSRDIHKSYDLLILIMASAPALFAILFMLIEPLLRRYREFMTLPGANVAQ